MFCSQMVQQKAVHVFNSLSLSHSDSPKKNTLTHSRTFAHSFSSLTLKNLGMYNSQLLNNTRGQEWKNERKKERTKNESNVYEVKLQL